MNSQKTNRDPATRLKLGRAGRKLIRLDRPLFDDETSPGSPPSTASEASRIAFAEAGRLLDLIWKAIRSDPSDRRRDYRHEAVEREAWVGWWTGENFGAINGRMENISRGGALIVLARRPPRKTPVWVYKDTGGGLSSVRAEVAGVAAAPEGAYAVRFRFATPCPTDLRAAVVCERSPTPRGGVGTGANRQT